MRQFFSGLISRVQQCLRGNRGLWIIVLLLLAERLAFLAYGGITYGLNSDDGSYVKAGIHFANTGIISIHTEDPSAQIMPGMPVFIGFFSLIFGEGRMLWLVLKLVWITLGSLTAFVTGKIVSLFAPRFCGMIAACFFLLPNFVWMDNLILTETPYIFLFVTALWAALNMRRGKAYFYVFLTAFFCAFMLRANIITLPIFVAIYLLMTKYDKRLLLRQTAIFASVILLFLIPWSIRNYLQFQRFIPLTYGSGNAILLGTYQGTGYPSDESLDYEQNVEAVMRERFADYYDETGQPKEPKFAKMLNLERDGIKAQYRMREWWNTSPKTMLYSYLYRKPHYMLTAVFYWDSIFEIKLETLRSLRSVELCLVLFSLLGAIVLKKKRRIMFILASYYLLNLATYAYSFSFDRYAELIVVIRYILLGIGIPLILEMLVRAYRVATAHNQIES